MIWRGEVSAVWQKLPEGVVLQQVRFSVYQRLQRSHLHYLYFNARQIGFYLHQII